MKCRPLSNFWFAWFLLPLGTLPIAPAGGQPPSHGEGPVTRRPRYIFEAIQMYAVDETGIDFLGANEVVALFESGTHSMFTGIYGDMDTGDTRRFRSGQQCITPASDPDGLNNTTWACDQKGVAGPVTLTMTLYEYDGPLRNFLFLTGFCIGAGDIYSGNCQVTRESTTIGRYRKSYTEAQLASAMLSPGQSRYEWFLLDNCSEAVTVRNEVCGYSTWMPSYAAYRVTIKITRVADEILTRPVMQ